MKRRLTSLCVLVLVLVCVFVLPATAQAATEGDYTYTVANGEATITGYTGVGGDITIPSELGGYPVTVIGEKAFYCNYAITSVVIPDSVITIGARAFECEFYPFVDEWHVAGVSALKSVSIGDGVKTIGEKAFYKSALTSVVIPDSVITIGNSAFAGGWSRSHSDDCMGDCSCRYHFSSQLTSLVIGKNVQTIGDYAFQYCVSLETVVIPDSVISVGKGAFEGARYDDGHDYVICSSLSSVTFGNGLETIGDYAFRYCDGLKTVTISDSVTTIGSYAFAGGNGDFDRSSLNVVTLGKSVSTIGDGAFAECDALKHIWVDEDNPYFSSDEMGALLTKDKKELLLVPNALLDTYEIPQYVTTIGSYALPQISTLYSHDNPELMFFNIPDNVTRIKKYAFYNCKRLGAVKLSNGIKKIEAAAFEGCSGLSFVAIPDSVTIISKKAFAGCYSLKDVYYFGNPVQWDDIRIGEGNACFTDAKMSFGKNLKITKQPASISLGKGKEAKITVKASGNGLTYTWYHKKAGKTEFKKSSVSGNAYPIKMSADLHGLQVYCEVSDRYGVVVKSNVVTVTLKGAAKITTQPKNAVVKNKKSAKVTVKATGSGLKYQWYYAAKGSSKFKKLSGATKSTYSVKMSSKVDGRKVYCIVKDKYGVTLQTDVVTLYKGTPAKITTQPRNKTVCAGKVSKITVEATGDGLKCQWYYKRKTDSKFKKSSSTSATHTVKATAKLNGCKLYCVVTDEYGNSVKSNVITLTVRDKVEITKQPKNVTVAKNKTAKVTVKATGDGLDYQWYYAAKGSSEFTKLKTTKATYSVKMTSKVDGRRVYCVVTDKYGNTVKTKTVTLKMK